MNYINIVFAYKHVLQNLVEMPIT